MTYMEQLEPNKESKIKVAVVHDNDFVRFGSVSILGREPDIEIVAESAKTDELASIVEARSPDLVIVNPSQGATTLTTLKQFRTAVRILAIGEFTGNENVERAIGAGVSAYLFTDADASELKNAARLVARGGRFLSPSVGRKLEQVNLLRTLTGRERQIVVYIARGTPTKKIGALLAITPKTVRTHIRNILAKFDVQSRGEVVATCLRLGAVTIEELE